MEKKKKLCMIIPTHWSSLMGGVEYQAKCLIERLLSTDQYEICYLARHCDLRFNPEGYRIIKISEANGLRRYGYFFDSLRLTRLLGQIKPDIIFQHEAGAYTGIAAHYARRNQCNMVWHIASDDDVLPSGNSIPLNVIDKKILEYGIRQAPHITAQTAQQVEFLERYYGRKAAAIVPNFHPLPKENITKEGPVKVVWVANFKPLKQPEQFIRLARDLGALNIKVECLMIGAPANWAKDWQDELERQMGAMDHLTYLRALPIEEVNSVLARSHIFVNTSRVEGFANTFIQAWMRKVPVVSLHVDPDGVLEKHALGYCCQGSYETLLNRVTELINNPRLRESMGEHAQAYALKNHSEENVNSFIELFNSKIQLSR